MNLHVLKNKKEKGFSLFELMIAITIASFLVIGVVTVYNSSKHTYKVSQVNARLQENIRFAVTNITSEIRQAGFSGCGNYRFFPDPSSPTTGNTIFTGKTITVKPVANIKTDWSTATDFPLYGFEGKGNKTDFPDDINTTVDENSDAIIIYRIEANSNVKFINRIDSDSFNVNTVNHDIKTGDIILLTNCAHTSLTQVTDADDGNSTEISHGLDTSISPGNCTLGLMTRKLCVASPPSMGIPDGWTDQSNTTVYKWEPILYYIAPSVADASIKSLYRLRPSGTPEELVDGIESMQVLYGIDSDVPSDGVANYFVKADAVLPTSRFNDVVSIKLGMLFSTVQPAKRKAEKVNDFNIAGTTISPPSDRKYRQAINTTIKLRNLGATL